MGIFILRKNEQMVAGIPVGKLNNLDHRVSTLESNPSGSFSKLTPTGTVDGSNQVFVFTSAPSIIVVDQGRQMQKVSSDGTVNWTGTTTVTLSIAPNFDIYGF